MVKEYRSQDGESPGAHDAGSRPDGAGRRHSHALRVHGLRSATTRLAHRHSEKGQQRRLCDHSGMGEPFWDTREQLGRSKC